LAAADDWAAVKDVVVALADVDARPADVVVALTAEDARAVPDVVMVELAIFKAVEEELHKRTGNSRVWLTLYEDISSRLYTIETTAKKKAPHTPNCREVKKRALASSGTHWARHQRLSPAFPPNAVCHRRVSSSEWRLIF